jgi:hypothetical protein
MMMTMIEELFDALLDVLHKTNQIEIEDYLSDKIDFQRTG